MIVTVNQQSPPGLQTTDQNHTSFIIVRPSSSRSCRLFFALSCLCVCFFFFKIFCACFALLLLIACLIVPRLFILPFCLFCLLYFDTYTSCNSGVSVSALTTNALNTRLVPAQVTKTLTPKCNVSTTQRCATGSVLPVTGAAQQARDCSATVERSLPRP